MRMEPFEYRVRVSPRGRTVRLRVTPQHGLEVRVPKGYDQRRLPVLLERNERWVRRALERAAAYRARLEPEPAWVLPRQIALCATGALWHVTARSTSARLAAVREVGPDQLLLSGALESADACRAALGRWLVRQARQHLVPRLASLSLETGLVHRKVVVRQQRTRWGSCSRNGTISLNAKLLLVPPHGVDYVLIHELCHLAELNHSRRFWQRVERLCPTYREIDAELRGLWRALPRWATKPSE
jgi:predicted metal-dependent hydrolase